MKLKRIMMTVAMASLLGGTGFVPSAMAEMNVTDVTAKQRYPWNGLVDITCKVNGIEGSTNGLKFAVAAVMPNTGNVRNMSHLWVMQDGTNSVDREVHTNGNYRLLWDARADLGQVIYSNMVVRVGLVDLHDKAQLWEGGPYWATTNIGAEKPEEYGYYFWWGDTVGYKREGDGWEFSEDGSTSNYCGNAWGATDGSSSDFSFDSSNTPTYEMMLEELRSEGWIVPQVGTYVLAPEHDAAQVQWGDGWRMPTYRELYDLCYNKCDWTWTMMNGVNGYVVRGRGDYAANSIFLPCAGFGDGTSLGLSGQGGNYWSSAPDAESGGDEGKWSSDSYYLYFDAAGHHTSNYGYRINGYSVRPVQDDALFALAGESAPFPLDTMDGTRLAQAVETITYSPHWNGASECSVSVDGNRLLSNAEEGSTAWPRPATPGCYTFTHVAGGETLTARFSVLGDDVAVHAGTLGVSETWGTNKTHLVTAVLTVPNGVTLTIERGAVVKFMYGASIMVESGGSCTARGVIFTHVNDDTIGGDTLLDGGNAVTIPVGDYTITGNITGDDFTEYRYAPPLEFGGNIYSDKRLLGNRTYIVSKSAMVAIGVTLTLPPGTILKFGNGCSLTVNGTLDAQGTRNAPVVFTSFADDEHGGDTNEDGDKTRAQGGDWGCIYVSGVANMKYCVAMYGALGNEMGILATKDSGSLIMDCCVVAHALYDGIWNWGGSVSVKNTVITDTGWASAPYRGTKNEYVNCVFYGNDVGMCYWSNWNGSTSYKNCVFAECAKGWCELGYNSYGDPSSRLNFSNCLFFNPAGFSAQSCGIVGSNGNIWGDPLFEDAARGDFRIAANSPCVDAGDGSVAPETDWWGQPRMDVKRVKNTGTPNGDGVCPDIGIYEVPGTAVVPLPDLGVLCAGIHAGEYAPGDTLTVTYTVTNHGAAAATGIVRDLFRFKGADAATGGVTVDAAEIEQAYSLAPGAGATMTATLTVPTLKAGRWKVEVGVNENNNIYEQTLSNNGVTSEEAICVELESLGMGTQSVTVGKGETAGFVLSSLSAAGGVVRIPVEGGAQIAAYGGNGAVPTGDGGGRGATALPTVPLADGSLLIVFPARAEGENAYLVLENGGREAATVSVEVREMELMIYGATPGRIANAGEATITITGSGLCGGRGATALPNGGFNETSLPTVTLGGREAKNVAALNAAQVAATFDVEGMAAGSVALVATVAGGAPSSATAPDTIEIYAAKTGPKLRAWLEMPSSVRDGRVFTGYVCYANDGDSPMTMPIFKVARKDQNTKLGLVASESMTETTLYVGGISPTYPAGVLKAGDRARIPFYFQPFGTYEIALTHVKDAENLASHRAFGGTRAYLAAMSAAATRLNLRGRTAYDIHDFVDQALWEKHGIAHAAVSGYLVDAKTGEPLANADISLVAADATSASLLPATGTTDESGYFQLTNLADGEYRWLMESGMMLAGASTNTVTVADQADLNGVSVSATPGGRISGRIMAEDGTPVSGCGVARTDDSGRVLGVTFADDYGMYRFDGLADGTNRVRAIASNGWVTTDSEAVAIDEVVRSAEVSVVMRRGGVVSGSVSKGGAPLAGGFVRAIAQNGASFNVAVADDGTYIFDGLAAGWYQIGYYSTSDVSDNAYVTLAAGDRVAVDLSARSRPLFEPALRVGFGELETRFFFTDQNRATNVVAWAWDFDSDGTVDSTEASPTWTYTSLGTNTVTLTITENGGAQTTSVYPECVRVEEAVETVLKDGAIVFGTNSGTLETLELGEGMLVLSGAPSSGDIAVGNAILGKFNDTWYVRRVTGVSRSGDRWTLTTEDGKMTDVYERFAMSISVPAELDWPSSQSAQHSAGGGKPRLQAQTPGADEDGFHLFAEGGVSAKIGLKPDCRLSVVQDIRDGHDYSMWAFIGESTIEASIGLEGNAGARFKESIPVPFSIKVPTSVPFLVAKAEAEVYFQFTAQISGTAGIQGHVTQMMQIGMEQYDGGDWKWLTPFPTPEAKIEPYGDVEGSIEARLGIVPKFGLEWLVISATVDLDIFLSAYIKAGLKSPLSFGVEIGADLKGETDLKMFGAKIGQWFTPAIEGPRIQVVHYVGPDPEFSFSPNAGLKAPADVHFTNQTQGPRLRLFQFREEQREASRYEWNFGNGMTSTDRNPSMTFANEGKYRVSLKAFDDGFITGPYRYKATVTVGDDDDDDDDDDEEEDDVVKDTSKQSWDPNEMVGEEGVGEKRLVKPGDTLTYTVYFENKAGFDIADAQEVKVTNPLSEWLDWSTFEMRDIGFNNQNDVGLDGLANGTSEVKMNGTNKYVRTTVWLDAASGVATWYLRVYDPNGTFGWPNDLSGFLPSNDDTHRGEGHITYRIKVRDDAPANVVITNSASIVFDKNDPIETDPAWWNTVTPVEENLQAGEYFKMTLAELGYDVPTDGTPYEVKALGLPAGLKLKYNAAVTKKVKGKTVVVKKAKTEWWIEGVPTAALDFFTNPPYLVITANDETTTESLPVEVEAQQVTELDDLALGQSMNTNGWLAGVGAGWTVSGLPTGLKYATKKVTKKSGKKTVTVAEAYAVYGKTTKAGLFTITAKKKVGAYYETMKYRVLVRPAPVDAALFGEDLTNLVTMAYVPVAWDLAAVGKVAKVTGLPSGVKLVGQTIVGTPTKPGTYVVTFTKNVKSGKKTVAKTAQILWKVEPNDVEVNLGFNDAGGVIESGVVGLHYGDLLAFSATSNATVTASGLPAGMKLVKVDGDGTYAFTGFTTKAGTYLVTVKATLNGKTVAQRLALKVEGLPDWAKGSFNGYVRGTGNGEWGTGGTNGLATVTVSAVGKISGKFQELGTNWTFSAESYTAATSAAAPAGFVCSNVVAKYVYKVKSGKKTVTKYLTRTFTLAVSPGEFGGVATLTEIGVAGVTPATTIDAYQNLWGRSDYKALGKKLFTSKSGKKTLNYRVFTFEGGGFGATALPGAATLSLKVTTAGAVTATLTYDTGKTKKDPKTKKTVKVYYKPTCTSVVVPQVTADTEPFVGEVPLYFAPSPANGFEGFAGSVVVP